MSLRGYRALATTPGVVALVGSSLAARLPDTMAVIALSFWARDAAGTFLWSGLVVGAYTMGMVVLGPWLGRFADRYGPRRVLYPSGVAFAVGFGVVAALPGPLWWLGVCVIACTGAAMPPVAATMRAALPKVVGGERLRLAYTLEATVQEVTYIVGPVVSAVLVAFVGSRYAVLGCGVVALVGVLWFASRPALAGAGAVDAGHTRMGTRRLLLHPGRGGLILGMTLIVASFSAVELGIVAFAEDAGQRVLSGVLEMVWSLGSFVGGVGAGFVATRRGAVPWRRALVVAVGTGACALAPDVWWLGGLLVAAGVMIAPSMAAVYERLGELAPAAGRTEAFAWISTAATGGAGLGAMAAGRLIASYGAHTAFAFAAGLCALAVLAMVPAKGTSAPGVPAAGACPTEAPAAAGDAHPHREGLPHDAGLV